MGGLVSRYATVTQENRSATAGAIDGIARLTWVTATFNDRGLHRVMGEAVYANVRSWEFYKKPVYLSIHRRDKT